MVPVVARLESEERSASPHADDVSLHLREVAAQLEAPATADAHDEEVRDDGQERDQRENQRFAVGARARRGDPRRKNEPTNHRATIIGARPGAKPTAPRL